MNIQSTQLSSHTILLGDRSTPLWPPLPPLGRHEEGGDQGDAIEGQLGEEVLKASAVQGNSAFVGVYHMGGLRSQVVGGAFFMRTTLANPYSPSQLAQRLRQSRSMALA